jgi:HAD superfamily hydrolase (TIGR01549 family)
LTIAIILFRDLYDTMGMNSKVQGVLFDFGGTLSKQQAPSVIQKILSDEGTSCSIELLERALELAWEEDALNATRSEFRGFTRPNEETEYLRLNRMILNHAGVKHNGEHLARLIHEKWAEYASAVAREAFEDVNPCLKKLNQTDLKMGVVSNIDSAQELQKGLSDLNITSYFGALVASGEVGFAKPHPEIFRIAGHELHLPTASLVHIGDLYAVDVIGAQSAGVTGILIDREDKLPNVECPRIRSLEELPTLVAEL